MSTITARTSIDATPERVWEVLSDFGGISQAAPHLTGSRLTGTEAGGVGASRHCDLSMPGVSTEEIITRWEVNQGYGVDIEMKGMPVRDGHAEFEISTEDGQTVLTGVMSYAMPFGPLGAAIDKVAGRKMASMWSGMLAGFKARAEDGVQVDGHSELPMSAVEVL
jgi:ligand-binding SRPBCC domain-containing protein